MKSYIKIFFLSTSGYAYLNCVFRGNEAKDSNFVVKHEIHYYLY